MKSLVVMGVAGCGKSTVAARASERLGLPCVEGDAFHSAAAVAKMTRGEPLTDADRAGWLARLAAGLRERPQVLACSALKQAYREQLRAASPGLRFAFLDIERHRALARVRERGTHFFNESLVDSQFTTLERPEGEAGVLLLNANAPLAEIETTLAAWWHEPQGEMP